MSVVYAESQPVRTRPWYLAHLTVLGAALVAAALHGPAAAAPVTAAATYQPPPFAPTAPPTAEVHTLSGASAAKPVAPHRTVAPKAQPARPTPVRPRASSVARRSTAPAPSFRDELDAAIARIPTYHPGAAEWVVSRAYAFWGTADWYHDVLYVSPDVPTTKLYDVAVHEWSHELSVLDYGGDVAAATAAMNRWFGGTDLTGAERAADCMAILQGARWTHYTTCTDAQWRLGAARLVAGQRL